MTLKQLSQIKRWLVLHGNNHRIELETWNMILSAWVVGWVALPGAMMLQEWLLMPALLIATLLPQLYVSSRRRLHRRGRLRCDWLCAI